MRRDPRLILFDCDGTLVDSQAGIAGAMIACFREAGLAAPAPAAVRSVIGLSLSEAILRLLPDGATRADADHLGEAYKRAFAAAAPGVPEPLYRGMRQIVEALDDAASLLGVATGKSRRGVERTLSAHGLFERFVTIQTADTNPSKPHPAMVVEALAETGIDRARTVVIGDSPYDILMAQAAGVASIAVDWGYGQRAALRAARPGRWCDEPHALPGLIDELIGEGA